MVYSSGKSLVQEESKDFVFTGWKDFIPQYVNETEIKDERAVIFMNITEFDQNGKVHFRFSELLQPL